MIRNREGDPAYDVTWAWERGPLTLRLEADINRDEALEIARSVH